ncbi:MAG: hypothetical protein JST30_11405 [Armatimonadetes bacterium]|nr:hypothetical protein [Armatimonadota bacterium]
MADFLIRDNGKILLLDRLAIGRILALWFPHHYILNIGWILPLDLSTMIVRESLRLAFVYVAAKTPEKSSIVTVTGKRSS